jgi:hypothetical protein
MWPVQELVNGMSKDDSGLLSENLGPYLNDLSDHASTWSVRFRQFGT